MYTLNKKERIHLRDEIRLLFNNNEHIICYPIRILYHRLPENQDDVPIKILFSAPKKRLKRAVDRNKIKRRMRESYRQYKHHLIDKIKVGTHPPLLIAMIYMEDCVVSYEKISMAIHKSIDLLTEHTQLTEHTPQKNESE